RRKRSGVDFATTSRHGQSRSPPAGGEISPCGERNRSIIAPSSAPFGGTFPPRGRLKKRGRRTPLKKEKCLMFTDGRSKKVIFLAHCLLNQNAISDGTAVCPAAFGELIQLLLDREVGVVQMPC